LVTPSLSDFVQFEPQYPGLFASFENGTWPVTVA
jgi:hypothetical protein